MRIKSLFFNVSSTLIATFFLQKNTEKFETWKNLKTYEERVFFCNKTRVYLFKRNVQQNWRAQNMRVVASGLVIFGRYLKFGRKIIHSNGAFS